MVEGIPKVKRKQESSALKGLERFQRIDKLGEGTYGVVYSAKDLNTGNIVALKIIKLQEVSEGIPSTAIREISFLKDLTHPNIIQLLEVIHTEDKLTLVLEFIDKDLKKILDAQKGKGLDEQLVKSFLIQLLRAIEHCHKHRVLHRDLKPSNLLVSSQGLLKLADFGLARAFGVPVQNWTNEVVTLWYRPPDILMGNDKYTTSVDVWSTGCIFAEMVQGRPLFTGKSKNDQILKLFKCLGTPTEENWPGVSSLPEWQSDFQVYERQSWQALCPKMSEQQIDLLQQMLVMDPTKRISAKDALKHPYLLS